MYIMQDRFSVHFQRLQFVFIFCIRWNATRWSTINKLCDRGGRSAGGEGGRREFNRNNSTQCLSERCNEICLLCQLSPDWAVITPQKEERQLSLNLDHLCKLSLLVNDVLGLHACKPQKSSPMNKIETVSHCRLLIHLISFLQLDFRIQHTGSKLLQCFLHFIQSGERLNIPCPFLPKDDIQPQKLAFIWLKSTEVWQIQETALCKIELKQTS